MEMFEAIEEEKQSVKTKDYSDLMSLAYTVMDLDLKISAMVRAKIDAEDKYKKAHIAYYEKYPEI
jgi:hypothetical protein